MYRKELESITYLVVVVSVVTVAVYVVVNMLVLVLVAVVVVVLITVTVKFDKTGDIGHVNSQGMAWRLSFDLLPCGHSVPSRGAPFHSTRGCSGMREYARLMMRFFVLTATSPGTCSSCAYWGSDSRYAARPETVAAAIFDVIKCTRLENKEENIKRNLPIDVPCCSSIVFLKLEAHITPSPGADTDNSVSPP